MTSLQLYRTAQPLQPALSLSANGLAMIKEKGKRCGSDKMMEQQDKCFLKGTCADFDRIFDAGDFDNTVR